MKPSEENHNIVPAGKLIDMKWKVGIAMSSDNCRNLNTPYVVLKFRVTEADGTEADKSMEMTIPEFQSLHNKLKEMSDVMTTI